FYYPLVTLIFSLRLPSPTPSTLFPYTTLFRSVHCGHRDTGRRGGADRGPGRRRGAVVRGGATGRGCAQPGVRCDATRADHGDREDRKSTRLNSSHLVISYAVFCLKKKKKKKTC